MDVHAQGYRPAHGRKQIHRSSHLLFLGNQDGPPAAFCKEEIADDFEKAVGIKLSVNDLLIKAVALTLLELPYLNAWIEREEIHIWPQVNIGLAVALPQGLIVPAMTDASRIGLAEIRRQRSDLVEKGPVRQAYHG